MCVCVCARSVLRPPNTTTHTHTPPLFTGFPFLSHCVGEGAAGAGRGAGAPGIPGGGPRPHRLADGGGGGAAALVGHLGRLRLRPEAAVGSEGKGDDGDETHNAADATDSTRVGGW